MSAISFFADVHIGNNRILGGPVERRMNVRCRESLRVLERAL